MEPGSEIDFTTRSLSGTADEQSEDASAILGHREDWEDLVALAEVLAQLSSSDEDGATLEDNEVDRSQNDELESSAIKFLDCLAVAKPIDRKSEVSEKEDIWVLHLLHDSAKELVRLFRDSVTRRWNESELPEIDAIAEYDLSMKTLDGSTVYLESISRRQILRLPTDEMREEVTPIESIESDFEHDQEPSAFDMDEMGKWIRELFSDVEY